MGGPQAEKALAALLLAGGRVVGLDALVDALWDAEPPPTAVHQVHKLIAGLRRRHPGRDRHRRPRLPDPAGRRHARRRPVRPSWPAAPSIPELTAALALWRGPALAGVDSRVLRTAAAALDDRRLAVLERLTDLRLAAGQAGAVAAELPPLVAEHPLRETLRRQLMTALYRCGRQAEALGVVRARPAACWPRSSASTPAPSWSGCTSRSCGPTRRWSRTGRARRARCRTTCRTSPAAATTWTGCCTPGRRW